MQMLKVSSRYSLLHCLDVGVIEEKNLGAKHCKVFLLTASLQRLLFSDSNASETQR
jgi:hypothetical protein